jgi:hypothetical protein
VPLASPLDDQFAPIGGATYSTSPGDALQNLAKALTDRGVRVIAEISLNAEITKRPDAGGELLRQIVEADPFSGLDTGTPGLEQKADST